VILLGFAFGLYIIRNTLIPLFVSMLIDYLLTPLVDYLENRGLGTMLAITIAFLLSFGILFLAVLYIFPLVKNQVGDLTDGLPLYLGILDVRIAQLQTRLAEFWPAIDEVDAGVRGWSVDIHPLGIVLVLLFGNQLFGW